MRLQLFGKKLGSFSVRILWKGIELGMLGVLFWGSTYAQDTYWISFKDKGPHISERLHTPECFLSPAAIQRRQLQGIQIDATDLPVFPAYLSHLKAQGIEVVQSSRWFNAAVARLSPEQKRLVRTFPEVKAIRPDPPLRVTLLSQDTAMLAYGEASLQNTMINLDKLHQVGFSGKGVRIAIFDGGFKEANKLKAFRRSWESGNVMATYDFVRDREDVFHEDVKSSHGTHVWSTMAAFLPDIMVGTAVDAHYILGITELPATETRAEEYNWIAALEWADSIGVDIVHSSLSYSIFDKAEDSYEIVDMDGNTTLVSQAADRAAAKGIIVTTGAGNEGNDPWRRITAPCDGDSVLCIGAVDKGEEIAYFSSVGPSSDGQVKPDVVAMGQETVLASTGNTIRLGSGTSYSSPIIAGMAACLRQAHPKRHAMDIIQAIRMSADRYSNPDSLFGYGIPDAFKADSLLRLSQGLTPGNQVGSDSLLVEIDSADTPDTPFFTSDPQSTVRIIADVLSVKTTEVKILESRIYYGDRQVFFPEPAVERSDYRVIYDIKALLPGSYYVYVQTQGYEERIPFKR